MSSKHDLLLKKAKKAINELFNDRSVSLDVTRESLEDLSGEVEILIESVDGDLERLDDEDEPCD